MINFVPNELSFMSKLNHPIILFNIKFDIKEEIISYFL